MEEEDPLQSAYANKHIPRLIHGGYPSLQDEKGKKIVQIVPDGRELTASALRCRENPLTLARPILVLDQPERIGMRLPGAEGGNKRPNSNESGGASAGTKHQKVSHSRGSSSARRGGLALRNVAELLGMDHEVEMIDVKKQKVVKGWTMRNLVDYFECEERKRQAERAAASAVASNLFNPSSVAASSPQTEHTTQPTTLRRSLRLQSTAFSHQRKAEGVVNQISLEFSRTPLEKEVRSPKFVRDIDWIDNVWPTHLKKKGDYPVVQYYCLTSPAGSYTDFHVDFGGSSVWYHVISGQKTFLLMPPTDSNLEGFEKWLGREDKYNVFFLDHLPSQPAPHTDAGSPVRVTLNAGQTFIIPSGWIHAVYTPVDSLVIGGNFLHGLDIAGQLKVQRIETRTGCPEEYAFPHFTRMMFYAGAAYLKKMKQKSLCDAEWEGVGQLVDTLWQWSKGPTAPETIEECLSMTGCRSMEEMLDEMTAELEKYLSGE